MTIPAYPLVWPDGWPRLSSHSRAAAKFGTVRSGSAKRQLSVADAVARVRDELGRMGVSDDDLVVSTNMPLRLDGWPRSDSAAPSDPGAAVYWREPKNRDKPARCMAIDRYERVADNLAAIAATLEAFRAIERHGGAAILDRAFTGFVAIENQSKPWPQVLGVQPGASNDEVLEAYRRRRAATHPDRDGGDAEAFQRVQEAYETFSKERGL